MTAEAGGLEKMAVDDGAEALVVMLNANGVEHIFLNSGTDTFPIQEAIVRRSARGQQVPNVVLCLDEGTAMAAAHGYFQCTGRPQVVLVHVDAGTAQIGGGYHNAQRDRAGIVVCAGRAPATFGVDVRGTRDAPFHWTQEQRDQAGPVRTFTKWDYELRDLASLSWVMQRAFQVATASPAGPVYVTLPRELLLRTMDTLEVPPAQRHGRQIAPAPDPQALTMLAGWLATAERPVIYAGASGRSPETVPLLVELAELVGAPVRGAIGARLNLPSRHFLNAVSCGAPSPKDADVILVLEHDVPWVPDAGSLEPPARIAWVDVDPIKDSIPLWCFPADLPIHASSLSTLTALIAAVRARLGPADRARIAARAARYREASTLRRARSERSALGSSGDRPIDVRWLLHCLDQVLDAEAIVLHETITYAAAWLESARRARPGSVFTSGGSSLGWALGAALGAKLASPGRDVVALVGDGCFVLGRPTSALWAAEKYRAPFLTVIFNNSEHAATRDAWDRNIPSSVASRTGNYVGVDIDPSPDYDVLARAYRAHGEQVSDPNDLLPALRRSIERIRAGQAAVLDVRVARAGQPSNAAAIARPLGSAPPDA